jgi:hypothetical protein
MGMAHSIWAHENGIELALRSDGEWRKVARDVGEAVLQVSLSRHHTRGGARHAVDNRPVLNTGANDLARLDTEHNTLQ